MFRKFSWIAFLSFFYCLVSYGRDYEVDPNISPCQDFYQYVCGKTIKNFTLPANRSRYAFAFSDRHEQLITVKKNYLRELAKRPAKNSREEQLKTYYLAEMDRMGRKNEEIERIYLVKQALSKIEDKKAFLEKIGNNVLNLSDFSFLCLRADLPNLQDNRKYDVAFGCILRTLPENSYYEDKDLLKEYSKVITKFFKFLGSKNPEKQMKVVLKFEIELAKVYPKSEKLRERLNSPLLISRKELNKFKNLYLNNVLQRIPSQTLARDIIGIEVLSWLDKYLAEISLNDLKTLVLFYELFDLLDEAAPALFEAKFQFYKRYLGGASQRSGLEDRAVNEVINDFEMEVDAELFPVVFPDISREKIHTLVTKVQNSLLEQLSENRWLSPSAKKMAIRKIKEMKWHLVAPQNEIEWNFNPVVAYYKNKPLTNRRSLEQAMLNRALERLKKPVETQYWLVGPFTINAYYNSFFNKIVIPAGILQPPFYDPELPEAINLGGIGVIIGHEMGHAIDDQGSKYDAQGNLKEWMTARDKLEFKKRTAQLISIFDQIGHNGTYTLGENIGDLVGLTTAYRALEKLDVSKEMIQGFFKQYGCLYCEVMRPGFKALRLKIDPHALGEARVNQQLQLQPGFKQTYGCTVEKKCVNIW